MSTFTQQEIKDAWFGAVLLQCARVGADTPASFDDVKRAFDSDLTAVEAVYEWLHPSCYDSVSISHSQWLDVFTAQALPNSPHITVGNWPDIGQRMASDSIQTESRPPIDRSALEQESE